MTGQSLAKLQPHSETQDRARARILAVAKREMPRFKAKAKQSDTLMDMLEDSVPHSMINRKFPS